MSSRLRGPARGGVDPEAVFHTNLLLLGYPRGGGGGGGFREATPPGSTSIPVTPTMFEHANPTAFQQVFHFLFRTLDSEMARVEFRDCWPILDRKQEAEFRRKLIPWLKDLQKDFPLDVPYTNPSLFQSPGGRKFVSFLATFSSFVLKRRVETKKSKLVLKTSTKNVILRETYLRGVFTIETSSLQNSVNNQVKSRKNYQKSVSSINEISEKYLEMKTMLNEVSKTEDRLRGCVQTCHEKETKQPDCDLDTIMSHCGREYDEVNKLREDFEKFFIDHSKDWDGIVSAMDDSLAKPKLNLSQYPQETMVGHDLKTIYENLLIKSLELAKKLTNNNSTRFPSKAKKLSEGVSRQATCLRELKQSLEGTVPEMVDNVAEMQLKSAVIDWRSSAVAPKDKTVTPPKLLLPPTPNLVLGNKNSTEGGSPALSSRLKLVSPHIAPSKNPPLLEVHKPEVEPRQPEVDLRLPETPTSGPAVSRRFAKKLVSSQSPLLRASLIQSTLRRVTPGDTPETPSRKTDTPSRKIDTPSRKIDTPSRSIDTSSRNRNTDPSLREDDDLSCKGVETPKASRFKMSSKDSLETFSPVLSSTKSPLISASLQEKDQSSRLDLNETESKMKLNETESKMKLNETESKMKLNETESKMKMNETESKLNETESKIEMYKKFLRSVKKSQTTRPTSPVAESATQRSPSLLDVWTSHKESLSPGSYRSTISETATPKSNSRTTPKSNPRLFQSHFLDKASPLFHQSSCTSDAYNTEDGAGGKVGLDVPRSSFRLSVPFSESLIDSPQGSEAQMDSLVVTRLDQLMNSLSLTGDNNLDLSLGRMSLGDLGDQLLSPHCP